MSEEIVSENPFDTEREHNPFLIEIEEKPIIIIKKENNILNTCLSFAVGSFIGAAGIITAAVLTRNGPNINVNQNVNEK